MYSGRIYTDLDNTLILPVLGGSFDVEVMDIIPRPGTPWFLRNLSRHGELWLLTAALREHAIRSLDFMGVRGLFRGILSREDLDPIERQISILMNEPGLSDEDRARLWSEIRPIAPAGVMFDEQPVGSSFYDLKSTALGIGPDMWIQVEPFTETQPDQGGLKKAYFEFVHRFGIAPRLMGGRRAFA